MSPSGVDLLTVDRGAVVAPAGCGKTQLIAEAVARHVGLRPILVLTHTNAGVAALRGRLLNAGVVSKAYRLHTLDGWAMRLVAAFPRRSGIGPTALNLLDPDRDYPRIREAAGQLLRSGHITNILRATFSRVIVDEYQDCTVLQHDVVGQLAQSLPTSVLGDPLQAVFGFGPDPLADWEDDVCATFPVVGELSHPWRWVHAESRALGEWLLGIRGNLLAGEPVDLRTAPASVEWVELDGRDDFRVRAATARRRPLNHGDCVIVLLPADRPQLQRGVARRTPGAVTVEAVELMDLIEFGSRLDLSHPSVVRIVLDFAKSVMTGVRVAALETRLGVLRRGTSRSPPSAVEEAAIALENDPTHRNVVLLLRELRSQAGARVFRPTLLGSCVDALQVCVSNGSSLVDATRAVRERYRARGRGLPRRAVGSTLLVKGLEAESVLILDADGLDARNLYVAMTRASKHLVVCSSTPVLHPPRH